MSFIKVPKSLVETAEVQQEQPNELDGKSDDDDGVTS